MDRQLISLFYMLAPSGTSHFTRPPCYSIFTFSFYFISLLFFMVFYFSFGGEEIFWGVHDIRVFSRGCWAPMSLGRTTMVTERWGKGALLQDGQKAWYDGEGGAENSSKLPCPCWNLSLLSEGCRGRWQRLRGSSAPGSAERGANPCWPWPLPPASLHGSSAISVSWNNFYADYFCQPGAR